MLLPAGGEDGSKCLKEMRARTWMGCSGVQERSGWAWSDRNVPGGGAPHIPLRVLGLAESLPGPPGHRLAVVLFFQFHQHSGETEGGPGVKGIFPKLGSGWRWGHPSAVHGLEWAAQLGLAGWGGARWWCLHAVGRSVAPSFSLRH